MQLMLVLLLVAPLHASERYAQRTLRQTQRAANEWETLFNGQNYAGFTFYIAQGPEKTFDVKDGCMWLKAPLAGYTYTRKKYRNYELQYEWKFERPEGLTSDGEFKGNSGVLLHIGRILKEWPQSVEVEGRYLEAGKLLNYGKSTLEAKDFAEARQKATRKVGDWNTTNIKMNEGTLEVRVNGQLVATGTTDLREGFIGFQAQGADILYRNIKVRMLQK